MRAVIAMPGGGIDALNVTDVPTPRLKSNELLVRVKAAALNHGDMLQRDGVFPPAAGESDILGVEIAGEVVAGGAETSTPVGTGVFGLVAGGGYAEFCAIDEKMAISVPPELTWAEAAALPEAFFTADTVLFELGQLQAGDTVLIHGGGSGIGATAIRMACYVGVRVACTVGAVAKVERARELGAELIVHYPSDDFVAATRVWTEGTGVSAVIDIVGADYLQRNLAVLAEGGRLMLLGVLTGTLCELDLDLVIFRRLQLKGTIMRPRPLRVKREIAERFRRRWLRPIAERRIGAVIDSIHRLDEVRQAHRRMAQRLNFGKIVLDLGGATDLATAC
jgi:putative PIG3 family NAD(P)H quinone oxidoreductase